MARETRVDEQPVRQPGGLVGVISASGAILIVGLGLAFVFVITLAALGTVPDQQKSTVATSSFTVLGTIVGAYFGVRVGAAGREHAEAARDAESIKVQELAAHLDPASAKSALDSAEVRLQAARTGDAEGDHA